MKNIVVTMLLSSTTVFASDFLTCSINLQTDDYSPKIVSALERMNYKVISVNQPEEQYPEYPVVQSFHLYCEERACGDAVLIYSHRSSQTGETEQLFNRMTYLRNSTTYNFVRATLKMLKKFPKCEAAI